MTNEDYEHRHDHDREQEEIRELREQIRCVEEELKDAWREIQDAWKAIHELQHPPKPPKPVATKALLTIGDNMPGAITVDTTNETVALSFVDDKGDVATAPDGATVSFASDNVAVATVAADPSNPLQGDITPVSIGSANISATVSGAVEADGVTPFPSPDPVAVTVSAGAAVGDSLVLSA